MSQNPLEDEILRVITVLEKNKWITVNEHLNRESLAAAFLDVFKDMTLKRAIEIFFPKELV